MASFEPNYLIFIHICQAQYRLLPDYLAAILFFGGICALDLAPPEVVFSGFRASALWLVLAGFVIGGAIEATGLGARAANRMMVFSGRSYPTLIICATLVGALMIFIAPSAIARVFILIPIVTTISEQLGFERGSNGRSGLVLAASLGTLIPAYAVLPSSAPNLVMLGTAERIFDFQISYSEYLAINFSVLAVLTIIGLPIVICRLLPVTLRTGASSRPSGAMTRGERFLLCILLATVALWVSDFAHGVSPAWVALGAAALCLAPSFGPGRDVPLSQSVNLGLWLFIAAIIGAGAVVSHTGFGDLAGKWLIEFAELSPGNNVRNFFSVVLIGMVMTALGTTLGAPAILTPLADTLSTATGWPIPTILMLQVPTWMFFMLPYQLPVMIPVMAMGGLRMGQCVRVLAMVTVFGVLIALPLQFLWLSQLGYL